MFNFVPSDRQLRRHSRDALSVIHGLYILKSNSLYLMRKHIILICVILSSVCLKATHIIGGTITYNSLGNEAYEVRLEVFRDCIGANENANFDDPASVGIYDEFGSLQLQLGVFGELRMRLDVSTIDTISLPRESEICDYSDQICVERAIYIDTLFVPDSDRDIVLSYQRCCRSLVIANIVDPIETGMTFYTSLNTEVPNRSPIFNETFPVAVYANTPFIFDAGATDPDGDVLTYELINPIPGATIDMPQPQPSGPPPNVVIPFSLGYSLDNVLGGQYPLTINAQSGEMNAIVSLVGVYQVSYLVKEYRQGNLIGTVRREFVFEVIIPSINPTFKINGQVYVDSITLLDRGSVQLLERDITDDSLHLVETKILGSNGRYSFEDIPPGVFYTKALVDSASIYFDDFLPSYYDAVPYWYDAVPVDQCDTSDVKRDIYLLSSEKIAGGRRIEGIAKVENSEDVPAGIVDLILVDSNNRLVQQRTSSVLGNFQFDDIADGEYFLHGDVLNSNIFNTNAPAFTVNNELEFLTVTVYTDSLTIDLVTAVEQVVDKPSMEINLYPNPSDGLIIAKLASDSWQVETLEILNRIGQPIEVIRSDNIIRLSPQAISFTTDNLAVGIYFVRLRTDVGIHVTKLIKI